MMIETFACLAASGVGLGLGLTALVETRRAIRRIEDLERLFKVTRQEVAGYGRDHARLAGVATRLEALAVQLDAFADSDAVLAFLSSIGEVDDPGPAGFVRIHHPSSGASS